MNKFVDFGAKFADARPVLERQTVRLCFLCESFKFGALGEILLVWRVNPAKFWRFFYCIWIFIVSANAGFISLVRSYLYLPEKIFVYQKYLIEIFKSRIDYMAN
jgi:hypothetical protein